MAVFQKNLSGDSRYSLKLEVNETSYSTENNTSEVSYVLTATKASGGGYWSNSAINPVNVVLNGEMVVDKKVSYNFSTSTPCTITLASGTKTISHDGDGSRTISVSAYFGDSANSLGNATVSGNLTLTTIPRASEPSCNNVTLGNAVTINTNRKSDAFTHTITVSVGGNVKETFNNIGASVSWTPSISTYAPLSTASSTMSAVIACTTYNNGTQIGSSKTCTAMLIIPDNNNTKPSASISYQEADSTMKSKNWGVFVQGKSKLAITVTGTGKYGASISNYNATVNGESKSSSNFTTNYLNSSGNQTINATVKDSRGFTSNNVSSTYNVVQYANPTINTAIALRTDTDGNENDEGTYLKYTFIASVSSVSNKNSALYKIGYKKTTDNYYTYVTIADSGYSLSKENQILDGVTLDTSASYDIIFEVIDAFSNTTIDRPITSGFDLMNFNASGKSMAIGKVSEAGANEKKLEIALETDILEDVNVKNIYTNGIVKYSKTYGTYANKWMYIGDFQFDSQGMFAVVNCCLGNGNNGRADQQILFKINMQQGWVGETLPIGIAVNAEQNWDSGIKVKIKHNNKHNISLYVYLISNYTGFAYNVEGNLTKFTSSNSILNSEPSTDKEATYYQYNWTNKRNTTDTYIPVVRNGNMDFTTRVMPNSVTSSMYNTEQDRLVTLQFISFWNGSYGSDNYSNLKYCHQGVIQAFPTNLYENASGTNGTVTLSETAANFNHIQIFFNKTSDRYSSVDVWAPNGKNVSLELTYVENNNNFAQTQAKRMAISGSNITLVSNSFGGINFSGSTSTVFNNNELKIYKVLGYKN